MDAISVVGLDLGKRVMHIHCLNPQGRTILSRQLGRTQLLEFFGGLDPATVYLEAGAGSHYVARQLQSLGHAPKLIPPHHVKPFVRGGKSDAHDAEAICEAGSRPAMRFVAPKSESQQMLSALHCIRQSLIGDRVRVSNQLHAFLLEFGVISPHGPWTRRRLSTVSEETLHSAGLGLLVERLKAHHKMLCEEIAIIEKELITRLEGDELGRRLLTIPGIGPVTACALLCELGDGRQFASARAFAASLGLTPRLNGTGGSVSLISCGRRGPRQLRTLLVLCARLHIHRTANVTDPLATWVRSIAQRRHPNVAACALANKFARIAWAIASRNEIYDAAHSRRHFIVC